MPQETPEIVVWFNARCSKCRAVRDLLEVERVPYLLRDYVDEPPGKRELADLLAKLGPDADVRAIARTEDDGWIARGLETADDDAVLDALVDAPELVQRPIAIRGDRAVVARPPELVRTLI